MLVDAITHDEASQIFSHFSPSSHMLLAVSGGADSVAMIKLAHEAGGFKLSAATVNHGLRAEALSEAQHVTTLAAHLNIPHSILDWQGEKPTTRLQERARAARYELLFAHAREIGATHVLTAHTLDDQAETILFRMARGSGVAGLIGMRNFVQHGDVIHARPLLAVPKERLVATCIAHNLAYVEDISNIDTRFARVRMRAILPVLAKEGLTAQRFVELSNRAKRIDDALEARVDQLWNSVCLELNNYDFSTIIDEPAEIILRFLLHIIRISHITADIAGFTFPKNIRLNSVEALLDDFRVALNEDKIWRKSVSGLVLHLDRQKRLKAKIDPRLKKSKNKYFASWKQH
jgi:tRNA(Ile)-lysidine synthase